MKMESEVVENKGLPGNGLTDSVAPEEEPLRRSSSGNSSGKRGGGGGKGKPRKEKISLVSGGGGEKMPPKGRDDDISGDEEDGRGERSNRLDVCYKKCRLTPKRALIYLLVSSLLVFLLLLILIIMAALWPSSPSQPTCQSAQCHMYSADILRSLNASVEPCQDMWEFSCGGWLQHNNPIPESKAYWDVGLEQEMEIKGKIRTLLNTLPVKTLEDSGNVLRKMKRFYDSCMGTEYIESDKTKPLERIISTLGGWNILRSFQKTEWDFQRVLKKLHEEHRASPYFHIGVAPDPRVPSRNIIKITPAGLSLPDKKYYYELDEKVAGIFTRHVKDIVITLGATSENARVFAQTLFNYERRIAEATPEPQALQNPVDTFQKITVRELKATASTIFWLDLLKAKFKGSSISDNTEVLVTSKQYLSDISAIISSTDKSVQNNYLMWHLTKQYLPHLAQEQYEGYDALLREITGREKPLPRWEFCIEQTISNFRHAADYLLSENCEDRPEKAAKVTDLFDSIRQSLTNRISEADKFDESLRNFFLDKLRLLVITVGTPFLNGTYLNDFYNKFDVQKNEWFTNVRNAQEFQESVERDTLTRVDKDTPVRQVLNEFPNKIRFLPSNNQVIVPESVLQRKVLQLGASHLPLLMGSVGVDVGQAVASAFGITQGLYGSGGSLMSDNDAKTQFIRDYIDQRRSCLVSHFVTIHLDERDYLERTSLDTTIHLAGIQMALNALENHELVTTFLGLPALENLPSNALFFVSYVQSQCSITTRVHHELEHNSFTTLSHDLRTRGLLRQMYRFTEALECPTSAALYADFSCGAII